LQFVEDIKLIAVSKYNVSNATAAWRLRSWPSQAYAWYKPWKWSCNKTSPHVEIAWSSRSTLPVTPFQNSNIVQ